MTTIPAPPALDADQLLAHIEHDTSICTRLLATMQQECEALTNRDIDTVEALIEEKKPLLIALERSAKQRELWVKSSATPTSDDAHWKAVLEAINREDISAKWLTLKKLYNDVRVQNEINGKLLTRHKTTLARLLDIMKGKTAAPNLYSAKGYSSTAAHANHFGEA